MCWILHDLGFYAQHTEGGVKGGSGVNGGGGGNRRPGKPSAKYLLQLAESQNISIDHDMKYNKQVNSALAKE